MPFDINTAREVPEDSGFDINTARVIDAPPANIFRESTQKVVQAPAGLRAREVEYLDDTQNEGKNKQDFLGMSYIGNPVDFSAGYLRALVEGSVSIGTLDLPYREKKLSELEAAQKLGVDVSQELDKTRSRISSIKSIRERLPAVIKGMGLQRDQTLAGDLGAGGQSLAQTIGLTMMTGNPMLAASVIGLQQKSNDYQEARQAGLPIDLANESSNLTAGMTTAIEAIGTHALFKSFENSGILKRAFGGLISQALEEGSQELSNILIKNDFGVTNTDFSSGAKQVAYAAFIGGLLGAPVAAMIDASPQEFEQKYGIPAEDGKAVASVVDTMIANNPKVKEDLTAATKQILTEEESPLTDNSENEAIVEKMVQDFADGKPIDTSSLSEQEQAVLKEMGVVSQPIEEAPAGNVEAFMDERRLFGLTEEELGAERVRVDMTDNEKLVEALGEEKAKLFKKLERQSNSMDIERADRAMKEMDELVKDFTPEQERLVYGVGEIGATADDYKDLIQAHSFSNFHEDDPIQYIAASTANAMLGADPIAVMNVPKDGGSIKEQAAFIRLTKGIKALRDRGVSREDIGKELVKGMVSRGNTESNAAEIVGNFMQTIEENAAPRERARPQPLIEKKTPTSTPLLHGVEASEFEEFSKSYQQTAEGMAQAAKDFVVLRGNETGNEWLVSMDRLGNAEHSVEGGKRNVTLPPSLEALLLDNKNRYDLHHNHPSGKPLSPEDFSMMMLPGIGKVIAYSPDGLHIFSAEPSDGFRAMNAPLTIDELIKENNHLYDISKKAAAAITDATKENMLEIGITAVRDGDEVSKDMREILGLAMQEAGLIRYNSTRNISAIPENIARAIIDRAVSSINKGFKEHGYKITKVARREEGRQPGGNPAGQEAVTQGQGGNKPPPPPRSGVTTPEPDREGDYQKVASAKPPGTFGRDAKDLIRGAGELASDAFVPVSTRLGKINEGLKHAVRRFAFDTGLHTQEDNLTVKPFIERASNEMSEDDYRVLDLALKNGDVEKINELMNKYGMAEDYAAMRDTLDKIHAEAEASGLELGFLPDYFPRRVKKDRIAEYLAFLRGQDTWSEIKLAMEKEDPDGAFTPEEQADFINKWLRGYKNERLKISSPSFAKERSIDYITPEMNEFYEDSMPTLVSYIAGMRHGIEARKLFGGSSEETEKNIGEYVLRLVDEGVISPRQEQALRKILKAVVEPTGTRGVVSWAKNATYVYTMASPIPALTQLQDISFSLYKNGYFRTGVSVLKSLSGKQVLSKEDLGITNILHEFEDGTRAGEMVRLGFKAAGFTFMDNLGKHVFIDAAWGRLRKASKKASPEFIGQLQTIYGDSADQVLSDLQQGNLTEDTKYLLFSELSDVQPISLAEMPLLYLKSGNGRVFYMLKTYTIKQLDLYRREIFDKLGRTSVKDNATGMKNLFSLAAALMLMGMGTDELKDFILGRETEPSDLVMDNILKTMGLTKYQIYKGERDGIVDTFWYTLFIPPIGAPIDDGLRDAINIYNEEIEPKDAQILSRVPIVGKFYYWWWGGGRTAEENKY